MLLAFTQQLNPLKDSLDSQFWSVLISTVLAALPVAVLFWLLVIRRWSAPLAGATGAIVAIILAVLVNGMPAQMAGMSFLYGAAFGMLPVGWTVFNAMLLYNITVETGQFSIVRRSVAGLSGDARIQAILIGFAFGAFLEGAAGAGTPVAICGAILVGLGFEPFMAAVLCLIANTSPVAYGGLGTPLIVLGGVTGIETSTLSTMAGHQLPLMSIVIPLYMVRCMCNWKRTFEVLPALIVSGGSFAFFQFTFATLHEYTNLEVYPLTDIGGGIFSLVVTAIFLRFWQPKNEFRFDSAPAAIDKPEMPSPGHKPDDPHAAEAAALVASGPAPRIHEPLTWKTVSLAWAPFGFMAVSLMLTGFVRQMEEESNLTDADGNRRSAASIAGPGPVRIGPVATNYRIPVPTLNQTTYRDPEINPSGKPEGALFNFAWFTAPGSAVFLAAVASMLMLRMDRLQVARVCRRTFFQMKIPIPTIACMLGLSYVTRFAGMDATLGYAFANTGVVYPFFAAILGWLGVFLTGTDAGSNALFGSLQKITATKLHATGAFAASGLSLTQAQVLISTANSTGGVMGKMIDAQSICVATAGTNQIGREADIFRAVLLHSIILASVVGLLTTLQAYVPPFTKMVPEVSQGRKDR
jgi:lactate permease